jgi:tyrosyl-tRNA synthetase
MFQSDILKELQACGFIKDIAKPEKLDALLLKEKITLYCGFDLTAKSLHVGNLMQIMFARKFLKHGHTVIFLLGGATTKIGDPTGKDETRKVISEAEIEANKQGILENFSGFFDLNSKNVKILNNNDWFKNFNYIDFLREVGTHFTINRMLAMESVKQRLSKEQSMNFVEFNYMLLQGYDFAYLNKHHNCVLQIGGSDQWGNVTEGMELCSRMNNSESYAITSPLMTRSDGQKMGKSLGGAVSLSSELTSSFEYFQYFRNMPDADVPLMLKIYTDLPLQEIEKLSNLKGKDVNEAKKILAFEATKLCRGEQDAEESLKIAEKVFVENKAPESESLTIQASVGGNLLKILLQNDIIKSISEGKTLLSAGALKLNESIITETEIQTAGEFKLSIGKKKHYKIVIS